MFRGLGIAPGDPVRDDTAHQMVRLLDSSAAVLCGWHHIRAAATPVASSSVRVVFVGVCANVVAYAPPGWLCSVVADSEMVSALEAVLDLSAEDGIAERYSPDRIIGRGFVEHDVRELPVRKRWRQSTNTQAIARRSTVSARGKL